MKPNPFRLLAAAAASATLLVGLPTMASAAAPVAVDDFVEAPNRQAVTVDVLANDTFEGFAEIVDARVVEAAAGHVLPASIGGGRFSHVASIPNPAVAFDASGVSVDFGNYTASQPGLRRQTVVEYTLRTDAGEQATGLLTVIDQRPLDRPVAVADAESRLYVDVAGPGADFRTHMNDEFSRLAEVTFEVVSEPMLGTVALDTDGFPASWRYTPIVTDESEWGDPFSIGDDRFRATPERTDEFTYRLCEAGSCSEPAPVTITYRAIQRLESVPRVPSRGYFFWEGGPSDFTLAFDDLIAPAAVDLSDATVTITGSAGDDFTTAEVGPDGSITVTEREPGEFARQRALPAEPQQDHLLDFRAADGTLLARGTLPVKRALPNTDFTLNDDEAWVVAGQTIPIRHLANDDVPFNTNLNANLDTWVSAPAQSWRRAFGDAAFGKVTGWYDPATGGTSSTSLASGERLFYEAGTVVGEDLIDYTVCTPYPTDASCKTATARIHVRPPADANDDETTAEPGTVVVDVAANDIFTDIPSRAAEFTLDASTLPAGVAGSMAGRQMTLEVPDSLRGTTFAVGYEVADFSGTDRAVVIVTVPNSGGPVIPDPFGPTAVDDYITIEPFTPEENLDILANDTVGEGATITLGAIPDHLSMRLTASNAVSVAATIDAQSQTLTVPYAVTDATGKTASAVIHVTVLDPDPVLPDAVDDEVTLVPGGGLIQVDVLDNDIWDVYGDGPEISLALAEEARAAGLRAFVIPALGGVFLAADESLAGSRHVEPYVLTDTAGSDQASIRITVLPLDEPESLDPPDARDDQTEVLPGAARTVRLLANDTWEGKADVTLVERSVPKGLDVALSPRGRVEVTAADALAGRTLTLRYRLADATGLADVAMVTVDVGESLVVVTGAERAIPVGDAAPNSPVADTANSPVALATGSLVVLLGALLRVAARRRTEAAR